ncbi:fidgetin-like protein [Skeletonema marinoi]|uniref:Fidgetin-like protein n=1 Tax=Skeletonema marinoi TaxID=267567 RepID=A0AAD8Y324_9STRA|nr:fidgetin-like protein [Skeletonema marinoi]
MSKRVNNIPSAGDKKRKEVSVANNNEMVAISDNEEEGGKNQSPIAGRKRKADNVDKQQSETAASNDIEEEDGPGELVQEIPENKDAVVDGQNDESDKSSSGVANLKDDNEQEASDMRLQKRARGEGNLKDDREQDASDVAPTQDEGLSDETDNHNWGGGDDQNHFEAENDISLEERATADVEQESIQGLAAELMDPNNSAEAPSARPKEMANQFEGPQSRSKSECAKQQLSELKDLRTRLKDVMSELEKKSEAQKRLELGWRRKEEELSSQIETSSQKLKEVNDQVKDLSAELIALKEKLRESRRNEAVTTGKLVEIANDADATKALSEQQQSTIHELRASLSAKESELQRQSETASRLKANLRSKEAELKAHMQSSAVELKEMTTEVAALNAKLLQVTNKEAALNVQLKKITDDFAADRASLESKNNQQQFTIEDLCDRLKERQSELNEKSEAIADLTNRQAVMTNQIQISAATLKEAAADAVEVKARLRDANTNEEVLKQQLKEMRDEYEAANALSISRLQQEKSTNDELRIWLRDQESELIEKSKFAADLRSKEVEMKEMTREMDVLNAKVAEATRNDAALHAQQQKMTDDFETTRSSSESALEQEQSTIDELRAVLKERQSELNDKSKTAERLAAELRSKELEVKDMSTEVATLNAKLVEQAQGSDVASLKTETEGARSEIESFKEALVVLKAKVSLLEEGKDREESTTTNSPKRVQPSRRSKSHPMNSLGAAVDQSSKTTGWRNKTPNELDIPEELDGLEKELVQKINNEIVVRGQEVTFDDIAGLEDAKNTVKELVIYPMKRPDLFTGLRTCPKGLLLFGPPGTGKAITHESGATFFSISASSLKSKWIGEGEKLVKTLFAVASHRSPSVVFIDEVDSMLTQRKSDEDEASRSMKNEFLVQLDGAGNETKGHVLVIGATNLPHELDDAARRRFVKRLYIPLPDQAVREQQLRTLLANNRHSLKDNEIIKLSHATDGYSCADVKTLCTDASMGPMRSLTLTVEDLMRINADEVPPISYKHFRRSLRGMNPNVQGGGNQNDVPTVVEVSDNEEEGGKKQSPIAGRKRKAGVGKHQSKTAASNYTGEDGPVRERSKEPTRRSKRLAKPCKPDYNLDGANTESEGNVDGNEEGEEATDHAPSEDNEQVQLDQKRGQPETSCEGRPVTALERDVLSEEDQGQDTYAGSTKRLQINSNENNVVAGKDDEASAMVTGVDQQARLQADPVDGHEVETEQCDDMWDGANQDKDDDEEVETQDTMVLSERDSGEIDVPKQVALHQSTVPESERMVSESKEEQLQQMEERYSALGKAVKQRDTTESELRSDLAEQVNITTNLQAQLDQATGENRRLQEQRVHDSDVWGEERKQMKNEYALVVHQHEVELKTRKAKIGSELQMKAAELQEMTSKASHAESRLKSVEEELARSATQEKAQRDEISRLNSENEDMKGRHEDAMAKEVAEKNRLQAVLESLRAQKGNSSEGKRTSPASSTTIARSRETRSQSRQRQSGRGSIATDQTYPKRRTSPRDGNKSDSNMKSSLETISEGGGACLGESTRKKTAEPKKRTATRSQNGEELPHGLEKELVQKINNEIVESGQEVTFDDIAGLEDAKNTVDELVILPMQRPDLFTGLRTCPKGLLLFGPPGTGKTMIGKAIAHESGATFFSISSSSLTSKWIGEGEKLVKTLFAVASYRSPSVVFIDEIDSMLTQRKAEEDDASRRMKTEFLVQLDGAGNERKGHVLVIGATNLPHELDDAARRRFVKRLYIPLPDRAVREQQLRTLLAKNSHSLKDNEIIKLSHATDGYSCADLKNLCTDASMGPMRSLTHDLGTG